VHSHARLFVFLMLVSSSFHVPLHAQNNSVTIPDTNAAPAIRFVTDSVNTTVFHGRIQGMDGLAAPRGYIELFYPPDGGGGGSELSIAIKSAKSAGRIFVETAGSVRTGVAFSNPNPQDVVVSYRFTDIAGMDFGNGSLTIPANGQIARFVTEAPFNIALNFLGSLTYTSSAAIGVIALVGSVNEAGLFLMPQVPVVDIGASPATTTVVPYFANGIVSSENCVGPPSQFTIPFGGCAFAGGNISTDFVLVNPTDAAISGTFQFVSPGDAGSAATPIDVTIGTVTGSTFAYALPPRSSRRLASGIASSPVRQGSIQINATAGSQAPFGFAILSFKFSGTTQYQTTVPGQNPSTASRILIRDFLCCGSTPTFQTSTTVAISNPAGIPVSVRVTLVSTNVTSTVTVPANGQVLLGPSQMQVGSGYGGWLRVSADSPVSIVGFQRFVHRSQFGSLAIEGFDESSTSTEEIPIPQLAVGNYESMLIVLRTVETQSSSAVVRFFTPSGQPADPKDFGLQQ
jgi:hypothetical protein